MKGDSGYLRCAAENSFGRQPYRVRQDQRILLTDVEEGFFASVTPQRVVHYENVTFLCKANNYVYKSARWERQDRSGSFVAVEKNAAIILSSGTDSDLYSHVAIVRIPEAQLQYEWTKNGNPIIAEGAVRFENGGAKLINAKMTGDDQGNYECRVHNRAGDLYKQWKVSGGISETERKKAVIIVGSCVGVFILLLIPAVLVFWFKWKKAQKRIAALEYLESMLNNDTANPDLIDPNVPLTEQVALLPYDDKWEFPSENLKLMNKVLGTGQFGKVVKAEAYNLNGIPGKTIVAVKMLKETADIVQRKALLGEIKIMMHIGQHLNVVNLLGAITKNMTNKGELYMLMEFCVHGALRDYLQRHQGPRFFNQVEIIEGVIVPLTEEQVEQIQKNERELAKKSEKDFDGRILTTRDLICYAFQISVGMEYLASHHVIHRDLAARNVLLAEENVVKICDFGLARQEYNEYIKKHQSELPVKWMAVECIYDSIFTTESDVWSFGILLWEMFTLGSTPYPGINIDEAFVERVKNGYRMERPYLAPKSIYEVMRHCWERDPKNRPTFSALKAELGAFLDNSMRNKYLDMNLPYQEFNEAHNSGYMNDQFVRNSKIITETDGIPAEKSTYVNNYKVLPRKDSDIPLKPRRNIRPTGTQNALNAMELDPMLRPTSKSPSPSRPGNFVENEDYLNDQFVNMPVNKSLQKRDIKNQPSFSDHSSGFHSGSGDETSPRTGDRGYLFAKDPRKAPTSSEV